MTKKKEKAESTSSILGSILGTEELPPALDKVAPASDKKPGKPQGKKAVTAEDVLSMNGKTPAPLPDEPRLRQGVEEGEAPPDLPPAAEKTHGQGPRRARTIYLTDDVYEAIRLREYREAGHMNRSDIVEEALKAYLRVELKELAMTGDLRKLNIITGRAAG